MIQFFEGSRIFLSKFTVEFKLELLSEMTERSLDVCQFQKVQRLNCICLSAQVELSTPLRLSPICPHHLTHRPESACIGLRWDKERLWTYCWYFQTNHWFYFHLSWSYSRSFRWESTDQICLLENTASDFQIWQWTLCWDPEALFPAHLRTLKWTYLSFRHQ